MTGESTNEDPRTAAFFDNNQPTYSTSRLQFVVDGLEDAGPETKLIDVGAGDGKNLEFILANSKVTDVTGLDVSQAYVDKVKENIGCDALCGSILDDEFVSEHQGRYDVAVMAAVLHHIVGDTRYESMDFAQKAVRNTMRLLAPGGRFFLFEPCFEPRPVLTTAFWIKRGFARLGSGRFEIGPSWLNIGEPIVSYYGPDEITSMLDKSGATYAVRSTRTKKLGGVITRTPMGIEAWF